MNYLQVVQVFSRIPKGPVLDMNQQVDRLPKEIVLTELRVLVICGVSSAGFATHLCRHFLHFNSIT
jgi:hypothetical protein